MEALSVILRASTGPWEIFGGSKRLRVRGTHGLENNRNRILPDDSIKLQCGTSVGFSFSRVCARNKIYFPSGCGKGTKQCDDRRLHRRLRPVFRWPEFRTASFRFKVPTLAVSGPTAFFRSAARDSLQGVPFRGCLLGKRRGTASM